MADPGGEAASAIEVARAGDHGERALFDREHLNAGEPVGRGNRIRIQAPDQVSGGGVEPGRARGSNALERLGDQSCSVASCHFCRVVCRIVVDDDDLVSFTGLIGEGIKATIEKFSVIEDRDDDRDARRSVDQLGVLQNKMGTGCCTRLLRELWGVSTPICSLWHGRMRNGRRWVTK